MLTNSKTDQGIVDASVLLRPKGIDQINFYKLIQYIQDSKLAYKIEGYAAHVDESTRTSAGVQDARSTAPVLHTLVSFLSALTNLSTEGRIFFQKLGTEDIVLSYLLLSPTHAFSSIASSARAIILAGGTMSPFDDYRAHLFPTYPESKITTLSCDHVIPSSNLCVWTLASTRPPGTNGNMEFEFSFQKRGDRHMISQLGLAIINLCSIVPDGVIVFFPSYGYLEEVVRSWETAGQSEPSSIWTRLQAKKEVFTDTRDGSSEETLEQYSQVILESPIGKPSSTAARGAVLLSVVGGKMSEGINFSDRLGRCVMIVGLPYPNVNSPEWKAKMEYIEATTFSRLTETNTDDQTSAETMSRDEAALRSKQAARDFYENACMRAVNQSIGRAIRHRKDYAAIVLVDKRYAVERIRGKLPGWIRGGIVADSHKKGIPQMMGAIGGFFRAKKSQLA
jgi:chromosome transmission fidelity protein 1